MKLNGKRFVKGIMRGYDQFMNLTLAEAVEIINNKEQQQEIPLGTVVCTHILLLFLLFF